MENEIWKPIKDYEGLYEVSSIGRVRSLGREIIDSKGRKQCFKERILKLQYDRCGYLYVSLRNRDNRKKFKVHRLVAEAFIPNPKNKPCVDHINTIRDDNRVENLRWVTVKENSNNELTRNNISESQKGKTISEETKKKISESNKGRVISEETRRKLSEVGKGREVSEETRKKISEIHKGKTVSEETKNKIKETRKRKPIIQLTLNGEIIKLWASTREPDKEGFNHKHIIECCKGKAKTHKGYRWMYYEDYIKLNIEYIE